MKWKNMDRYISERKGMDTCKQKKINMIKKRYDEMHNDCSLIQITRYKQMALHKDPLILWARVDKGIHCIITKGLFKNKGNSLECQSFG